MPFCNQTTWYAAYYPYATWTVFLLKDLSSTYEKTLLCHETLLQAWCYLIQEQQPVSAKFYKWWNEKLAITRILEQLWQWKSRPQVMIVQGHRQWGTTLFCVFPFLFLSLFLSWALSHLLHAFTLKGNTTAIFYKNMLESMSVQILPTYCFCCTILLIIKIN